MCVIVLEHRLREAHPLVLLHNRDEAYARPFAPPRLLDVGRGIVAPRDLQAGGSWLGTNKWGLVAAIANRHGEDVEEGTRSRGLIVLDVLRQHDAEHALGWVRDHLDRFAYSGFHLLLADAKRALVVRHRGASVPQPLRKEDTFEFLPGLYVVTNRHEPGTVPPPAAARPRPGEGHQHHPDLAGPHVKPAAEILGQEPHPHDFQDHHREASKEDQQKRNKFLFYQV